MRRDAEANPVQRLIRALPANALVAGVLARLLPPIDRLVFRLTRKRHTLTSLISGLPVVLLETTGARSGQARVTPVLGIPDGDEIVVIASNWGQRHHPAWYQNLWADPTATVTVNGQRWPARARETAGDERARRWEQGLAFYPAWTAYERRAGDREIPVMVLTLEHDRE